MKLKPIKKKKAPVFDGSYTEAQEQFLGLKKLDMKKCGGCAMTAPITLRPHLSRVAKANGIDYTSRAVDDKTMILVRI